jgi:hypothetical protein
LLVAAVVAVVAAIEVIGVVGVGCWLYKYPPATAAKRTMATIPAISELRAIALVLFKIDIFFTNLWCGAYPYL